MSLGGSIGSATVALTGVDRMSFAFCIAVLFTVVLGVIIPRVNTRMAAHIAQNTESSTTALEGTHVRWIMNQ